MLKAQRRETQLHSLLDAVPLITEQRASAYYWLILKSSCKLFNLVYRLRKDHPLVNRPFIYNEENLQKVLVRDILNLRQVLLRKFPWLRDELSRALDRRGNIVKVTELPRGAGMAFSENMGSEVGQQQDDS